ncbi:hypothetical protein [Paenarthrobacter nicotinovorans]|uniref:hypothetical protein n=1 Tax=Paenarthrobacter nicotinovorans TaxID=29320 RepID=UPI002486973F|nr:hypothetical protein [Paenarthrobacter nicotinovorans]
MEKCTVFVMADPDALPVRYYKAWEYFLPGDEVDVRHAGGAPNPGVVVAVMPDGSGMWVYVNGVGQRLFSVEEDVDITVTGTPAGADREKA